MLLACSALLVANSANAIDVAIDRYGVPCISAKTMADAVYALGYEHVELMGDRVATNFRIARGRTAELFGKENLLIDSFL